MSETYEDYTVYVPTHLDEEFLTWVRAREIEVSWKGTCDV